MKTKVIECAFGGGEGVQVEKRKAAGGRAGAQSEHKPRPLIYGKPLPLTPRGEIRLSITPCRAASHLRRWPGGGVMVVEVADSGRVLANGIPSPNKCLSASRALPHPYRLTCAGSCDGGGGGGEGEGGVRQGTCNCACRSGRCRDESTWCSIGGVEELAGVEESDTRELYGVEWAERSEWTRGGDRRSD